MIAITDRDQLLMTSRSSITLLSDRGKPYRPPSGGSEELQRVRRHHYRDTFPSQAYRQHHPNQRIHCVSTRQRRPTGWRRRAIRTLSNSVSLLVFDSCRQPSLQAALSTCRRQSLRCCALSPTATSLHAGRSVSPHRSVRGRN